MKLIRELLEYCGTKGLLTGDQYRELAALCASAPGNDWGDYGYSDVFESWELLQFGSRDDERHRKMLFEQGGDPEPVDPTDRRGKHGSRRRMPPEAGVRAKSGRLMRLPALAEWLVERFGELLAAPERVLDPIFLVHRAAGLSSASDEGARNWDHFEKAIRDVNGLDGDAFARAFEKALLARSKACLSLNQVCRYICDDSETQLPDVHGPAVNAYRLVMGLRRQAPPIKLRWILRNSAIDVVHRHHMMKFGMADALARLWEEKRDVFEKACLKSVAPVPRDMDWYAIARYKDMTAMEMMAILRKGEDIARGSANSRPRFARLDAYFSHMSFFGGSAWATALLVDAKATLALLAARGDAG